MYVGVFAMQQPRRHNTLCACRWPLLMDRRPNRNEMWNLESNRLKRLIVCPSHQWIQRLDARAGSTPTPPSNSQQKYFESITIIRSTEHWKVGDVKETNDVAQLLIGVNSNNNIRAFHRTIKTRGLQQSLTIRRERRTNQPARQL